MKKLFLTLILFFVIVAPIRADYEINNFDAQIEIEQNTRLKVTETLEVNFLDFMHGIYRNIPVVYSSGLTRINGKINVISVTDQEGNKYKYTTSRDGDDVQIKIGDPNQTITGSHTYKITYEAKNIVRHFADHDELYWNITGSDWDTQINTSRASVTSNFADIKQTDCFTGPVGGTARDCEIDGANFVDTNPTGVGSDFTIVVGLAQPNKLRFPSVLEQLWDAGLIWFVVISAPALFMAWMWWNRGRDLKFIGDNVYDPEASTPTQKVPLFGREHLPMVYSPINTLTPAEAGTIIDQKVDLADLTAEIMELARLGYIKIQRIEHKKLLVVSDDDYLFIRTKKTVQGLKLHQENLLEALTKPSYSSKDGFLLSKMKQHFYVDLEQFRKDLYKGLTTDGIFSQRPDSVRGGWIGGSLLVQYLLVQFLAPFNPALIPMGVMSGAVAFAFAFFMPRRTAKGHALYRQLVGLQYFVGKGKWRYEIAEKNLFLEEILPLAISLGVVGQLTHDMQDLALETPQYMGNVSPMYFGTFQNNLGSSMSSRPHSSGSSWSGGSGFGGGGSSGGGGGGGGGGGW